jgi:hypothetical protein
MLVSRASLFIAALVCASGCGLNWDYPEAPGGAGGQGGAPGVTITIVQPQDGAQVPEGSEVTFVAHLEPAGAVLPENIGWWLDESSTPFGSGYQTTRTMHHSGSYVVVVRALDESDASVASDSIQLNVE